MNLSNLKIGARLALGFAAVLTLLAIISAVSFMRLNVIFDEAVLVVEDLYPKVELVHKINDEINTVARQTRNIVIMDSPEETKKFAASIKQAMDEADKAFDTLQKTITSEKGKALVKEAIEREHKFKESLAKFMQKANADDFDGAKEILLTSMRTVQLDFQKSIKALGDYQNEQMEESGKLMEHDVKSGQQLILIVSIIAGVIGALLAWLISRSITAPIRNAVTIAQTVAGGDLTSVIDVKSKDETGELMMALKSMNESLQSIVSRVREGTDTIASASDQITSGNSDLSSRTEQQASSLEETASSIEELTVTVKQNADNAKQANQLAVAASDVATKGGDVVAQVVSTMGSINESSKKIVDIIGVIDGIAFQTNILALNAAVEAARAGEQGRGFAVVAAEVRSLAQRSAAAAKEIKDLIGNSVEKVVIGTKLVDEAGSTMEQVVSSIRRVTDIVGEITAASQEQSNGIEQVNQAITLMDKATQQNAALVEEASASAEALKEQADDLSEIVKTFKLK